MKAVSPLKSPKSEPVPTIGTIVSDEKLLQDAAAIDAAATAQQAANPLDDLIAEKPPAVEPPRTPQADPAVRAALLLLVTTGTKVLQAKQHWSDPGDEWRGEVARLGAVLVDRYLPNFLQEQGELVSLLILIGSYVGANLLNENPSGGSGGDPRATGNGQKHFVESDPAGRTSSNVGHA